LLVAVLRFTGFMLHHGSAGSGGRCGGGIFLSTTFLSTAGGGLAVAIMRRRFGSRQATPELQRDVFIDRAGVGLLFLHAQCGQHL
jgi:hypothetical protein